MKSSESIKDLAAALCKAQAGIKGAVKDSENPYFKSHYADLESVWSACREQLTSNGLSVVQIPKSDVSKVDKLAPLTVTVETVLMHTSGQYIADEVSALTKSNDPQAIGSCISYLRRYALAAFVGIYQTDDDAESATHFIRTKSAEETKPISHKPVEPAETLVEEATITGLLKDIKTKSGANSNGKWKSTAISINGIWYSTFDTVLGGKAERFKGEYVTISYKPGKFNTFTAIELVDDNDEDARDDEFVITSDTHHTETFLGDEDED